MCPKSNTGRPYKNKNKQKNQAKKSGRSKSSGRWLQEHFDDIYVKKAQQEGYRSRASYKLLELQKKDRFLKPGMTVVDLGAAPGGWCQVVAGIVGDRGSTVASDILPMDGLADVSFIQGDFTEQGVFDQLVSVIGDQPVDVVLSDMAPNMSGNDAVDQPRAMYLVELAVDMVHRVLVPGGTFVCKVFQGEGFDELVRQLRPHFQVLRIRKPTASRPRSREVYMVASGYKGAN